MGRPDRRRRARPHRRRQLGVGRRRRDRARPHPRADQPVARRLGCRDRARIRHGDKDIRRRRLRASGGQVPDRVGGPRHPAGGNRFRSRLDDRVRLPPGGQALATRPAAVAGGDVVLRTGHRRDRVGIGGPHPRIRAHAGASGGRLLQRSGLRVTRRRTGADRRTHRRVAVGAPGVAADRAPHRLVHRLGAVPRRLAAGRRLREIPRRHSGSHRRLRARRAHLPASVRLDAGQIADGNARRRREQGRGRHPRRLDPRAGAGPAAGHRQHRHRRGRRHRRRNLPRLQRLPDPVATAARRRGWDAHRDQAGAVLLRRRGSGGGPALRHLRRRDRRAVLRGAAPPRPVTAAGPAGRLRRLRGVPDTWLRRGARPAVALAWRRLRAGQHPRRRRVWPGLAHPGHAGGPAQGGRGFRRGGPRPGGPGHHDGAPTRRAGRQQRRPADGHHADEVPGALRRAGVPGATAGHEALPSAARRGVLGGRVRRPG